MPFEVTDLVENVRSSRRHVLKHLKDVKDDQWDWKPYTECKSLRETIVHMIVDDITARESLISGGEPDYEGVSARVNAESVGQPPDGLLARLAAAREELLRYVVSEYGNAPLDKAVSLWGGPMKLGSAIAHISSEDYYHAGQVAFIRMATDPGWDYYSAVYFGE